jgi:hypothetical protein
MHAPRKPLERSAEEPQESGEAPEKLGPYALLEQMPQSHRLVGEFYLATHEVSGASAMVFKPAAGPEREPPPRGDWQVRYLSSGSPGYLALEVERSPWCFTPGQPRGEELVFAFEDVRAGVERMAQALLDYAPSLPRWRRGVAVAGGAAVCALLLGVLHVASWPAHSGASAPMVPATPAPMSPEGPTLASGLDTFTWEELGGVVPPGLPGLARPLPREPFKGQKRPPCTPRSQTELIGACWVAAKVKAPCPEDLFEHQGECYVPVMKAPPVPQSLRP